jgi:hypothetical protein
VVSFRLNHPCWASYSRMIVLLELKLEFEAFIIILIPMLFIKHVPLFEGIPSYLFFLYVFRVLDIVELKPA